MQEMMYVKAMQAQREREIAAAIRVRGLKASSPSVRRVIGLSIMKIGARLAAEPQPRLARSA
ncbi:MAG: hypothetical protein FIA92_17850 [Chloroflexi bacterium]|nr:hypothetical protein [Chloroflexota bacterium]